MLKRLGSVKRAGSSFKRSGCEFKRSGCEFKHSAFCFKAKVLFQGLCFQIKVFRVKFSVSIFELPVSSLSILSAVSFQKS